MIVRRSHFEKHNDAAFIAPGAPIPADGRVSGGEIGHIHADGSLHAVLASADAAQAIDHRWGELHPLAGRAAGLPGTYVLLYAPRNPEEDVVAERLLDAAAAHMTANHHTTGRTRSGADHRVTRRRSDDRGAPAGRCPPHDVAHSGSGRPRVSGHSGATTSPSR